MLYVSMLIWNLKPAVSIAFYAHCFVQSVWAGIGIADLPVPVEVVLAGSDQVPGYLLTADRSPAFRSRSSVIYRCREEEDKGATSELCPLPPDALPNPAAIQGVDPASATASAYTDFVALGSWQQGVQTSYVARFEARRGSDFGAANRNGLALGDGVHPLDVENIGNGNKDVKSGIPDDGNPGVGNPGVGNPGVGNPGVGNPGVGNPGVGNPGVGNPGVGNPGVGNPGVGNPGVGNPGVGNPGVGNPGNGDPPIAVLSAPEPASLLIWLGAGVMGTGGAVARFRRRTIKR